MKHLAPTIVLEVSQIESIKHNSVQFITYTPSDVPTDLRPLGSSQPAYQRRAEALNAKKTLGKLGELSGSAGYVVVPWPELPEYLQEVIREEIGLARWTQVRVLVRVKGSLPSQLLMTEEQADA
jgi:hypothetical protein